MFTKSSMLKPLALAALLATAGAANAAISVVTSLAAFNAATTAQGTDTYAGFSITGTTPSPITRTAGPYTYTAAASTSTFFGAGTTGDPWLSTNLATDSVTFTPVTSGVNAIGGQFFGSDISGLFLAGDVTLTATDSLGATSSLTITGALVSSFRGFISTGNITSLTLAAVQGASPVWPTADNLVLAKVAAIPEPGTYGLMALGLGFVGFVARRRRA